MDSFWKAFWILYGLYWAVYFRARWLDIKEGR